MTSRIHILPEELCNKIAAGEVVERPASVVKELLENSLDAGAHDIRIEIRGGGRRSIRVIDDGEGMGRDDVLLCLERHATSKIRTDEDLFRLCTLGFRGEALPSIASVSRLTLRSSPAGASEGWEIVAEGGTVKKAGVVGMARGTTVEVQDLFFNTPARRKFLRRDETEMGHVAEVVTRVALAHPEVRFRLVHEERTVLDLFRQATLEERVAALLGRPLAGQMLAVDADGGGGLRLQGLLSPPEVHRSTAGALYTYINGRYIRDRVVQHALLDGYRPVLEKGRYPAAVLFLAISPEEVDVNVHPTKHEVRFRDQGLVHAFISQTVRERLRPAGWLASAPPPGRVAAPESSPPRSTPPGEEGGYRERVQEALLSYSRRQTPATGAGPSGAGTVPAGPLPASPAPAGAEPREAGFFSSLAVIGQYRRSYILAEDGDDLLLIDQHAAHERIGFEALRRQYGEGSIERQALLFPAVLEVDFREAALLGEQLEEMARLGFELEPFGPRSFALKSVPALLDEVRAAEAVRDVAAELAAIGSSGAVESAIDRVLALLACHGAVRANQTLSLPQIHALLRSLDRVDFKGNCPHGRPVVQRLTLGEVERMFRRS